MDDEYYKAHTVTAPIKIFLVRSIAWAIIFSALTGLYQGDITEKRASFLGFSVAYLLFVRANEIKRMIDSSFEEK
jgi:hypothetical protein